MDGVGFSRRRLVSASIGTALTARIPSVMAQPAPATPTTAFGTFYQPWRPKDGEPPVGWQHWMAELSATGVSRLILQWVSWENDWVLVSKPGDADQSNADLLRSILNEAQAVGISVWLGLDGSELWWCRIAKTKDAEVQKYLDRRLLDHRAVATALTAAASHPAFGGWYLPDEIDDANWRSSSRTNMMGKYLQSLTEIVHQVAPNAPIATSAFAWRSRITPADWGKLLTQWFDAAPRLNELLMQDGVGTKVNTVAEAQALQAASDAVAARRQRKCTPVIEFFEPDGVICKDPDNRTAELPRIQQQMTAALAAHREVVAFSVPEYAIHACDKARSKALREWLQTNIKPRAQRHTAVRSPVFHRD